MTFSPYCIVCGGPVVVWDETLARCGGFCKAKQEPLENLTPELRFRMYKRMYRMVAIARAQEVQVKGDVL